MSHTWQELLIYAWTDFRAMKPTKPMSMFAARLAVELPTLHRFRGNTPPSPETIQLYFQRVGV